MPHAYTEDPLVEQPSIGLFAEMKTFLAEAEKIATPPKETTIFALGGRGYYENPASELLAFFLKPDAEHGLGNWFLSTFLECMEVDHRQIDLNHVDVKREVRTEEQNRIDLQILGADWCLLIENKIYHWEANPFASYEDYASRLDKKTKLFAVLSPSGRTKMAGKKEDWRGVSYLDYCKALRLKLPEIDSCRPPSKWRLFALELILHLENELYNQPMTPEQANFLERHAAEARQIGKLLQQYPLFLSNELKTRMEKALGYEVRVEDHKWAIRVFCPSRWGKDSLAFRPPTQEPNGLFRLTIYTSRLTPESVTGPERELLEGFLHEPTGPWTSRDGFQNREDALVALIERVGLIEARAHNT